MLKITWAARLRLFECNRNWEKRRSQSIDILKWQGKVMLGITLAASLHPYECNWNWEKRRSHSINFIACWEFIMFRVKMCDKGRTTLNTKSEQYDELRDTRSGQ